MENMENTVVMNEVADVASAGTGCGKTAAKIGIAAAVTGGVGFLVYKGVKKIKNVIAAKKAAKADDIVVESEE